jgi:beta-lactamase superfamily II metal-dependent hydrolase
LLALFVPIAGSGPPVVRSAIGCALASVAPCLRAARAAIVTHGARSRALRLPMRADPLSLWSLALVIECVLHPHAVASLSVQLSYAATLGLLAGTGPLIALLRGARSGSDGWVARVGRTGRERSPAWRIPLERAIDLGACALAASIAAVLATLPFAWTRLCEWSPAGIVATPALVPSMTALLVLGWVRVLVPALAPDALLDPCAQAMTASMRFFDTWAGTPTPLPPRPFVLVAIATVLAFVVIARPARKLVARAAACAWAAILLPWSLSPDRLEVVALDVGAGTAVVLRSGALGTWIFDAGSRDRPDVAREALGPYLRRLDVGRIGVVLSHADRDHDSALYWMIERFPPDVWAGALPAHSSERLPHATRIVDVAQGRMRLRSSPSEELWLERGLDQPGNEGSRCLRVRRAAGDVVLTGDAEAEGLAAWLRIARDDAPVRLLLWPHHGSDSDRIGALLDATKPAEVWISSTAEPAVAAELDRRNVRWSWTARDGPLMLGSGTIRAPPRDPP